ncbi:dopamine beta-hydroxylase [Protopterus annectens]|uniref:dopamine beta-hydroxylase n=1 Tax=Protopterus annectens TaxID=7888 RepID=UPI001CFC0358|nr:dopamine beta-hydroxylase [Protopterus annectens]
MQGADSRLCFKKLKLREIVSIYFMMIAVFLVILVASFQGSDSKENHFPYKVVLDPYSTLILSWNVSYAEEMLHFQLLVKETKYGLLFGMSDRGEFENADFAILWSDGLNSYFGDAWSDQYGYIHLDSKQDYQLLDAHKTQDGLYLLFKRAFSTCDPKDYLIEDGTVHIVYGFLDHPTDSVQGINISSIPRGMQRVQLLKTNISIPELPMDVKTIEIVAPNVTIPGQETTYWCYITELPQNFRKHHIVKYEAVITQGNQALVHHMEVFQCAPQFETIPYYNGPCDSKMKPERLNYCRHVLAAWAMGAEPFYYPKDAGLAFGGETSSRFLRLEVHYHNPLKLKGHKDSSGIRLYYTPTLRRYDAGIMELGLVYTPVMAIPPQETNFVLTGYCTDKCTQTALPANGIHIFASQLHTHLTGRKVVTTLVRQGKETEIVNIDNHFSAHFQEIRMLKKQVTVLPGDVLITSCTYNTMDREQATVGGFGIMEEMCVNYVHYYPLTELELCKSAVDLGSLQKYFIFMSRFNDDEICTCPQASITEQFDSVPWNSFSREVLKSLYDFTPISMHCKKSTSVKFPGDWEKQPLPKITSTLIEEKQNCPVSHSLLPESPSLVHVKEKKYNK